MGQCYAAPPPCTSLLEPKRVLVGPGRRYGWVSPRCCTSGVCFLKWAFLKGLRYQLPVLPGCPSISVQIWPPCVLARATTALESVSSVPARVTACGLQREVTLGAIGIAVQHPPGNPPRSSLIQALWVSQRVAPRMPLCLRGPPVMLTQFPGHLGGLAGAGPLIRGGGGARETTPSTPRLPEHRRGNP